MLKPVLVIWALTASAGTALAFQPELPPWTAPPPPSPAKPEVRSANAIVQRVLGTYRAGVVAQQVRLSLTSAAGKERTSVVGVRTEVDETHRRVALRLGRALQVWADGTTLEVTTPRNAALACVIELPGGVSAAALNKALRPVPLPQVEWALGAALQTDAAGAMTLRTPPLGDIRLDAAVRESGQELVLTGATDAGPCELRVDAATGLLRKLSGYSPSSGGPTRVELVCTTAESALEKWHVPIAGRQVVQSIADLKPAPAEVPVGGALPNMGLMTKDLAAFSWRDELARLAAAPQPAGGPWITAIVFYRAGQAEAGEAALNATGVLHAARRDIERKRVQGAKGLPRLVVRPTAVFELAEFSPAKPKELAATWQDLGDELLWTSSGQALIDRFAPGSPGVVVLADEDQVVRAIVPLEAGTPDAEGLLPELRALVDELTSGTP